MRKFLWTLPIVLLQIQVGISQPNLPPFQLVQEYIEGGVERIADSIRSAVAEVGGDIETQQVFWVFGFSTGHFDKDPSAAEFARRVVKEFTNRNVIVGERVAVYAWEMSLWNHSEQREVQIESAEDKQKVFSILPKTPRTGSVGGHDTEKAIVELVSRHPYSNTLIILLVPDAPSVAPRGMQVIGENHPDYRAVLQSWVRIPGNIPGGASLRLPYRVIQSTGRVVDRKMDVVIVFNKQFSGAALVGGRRSEPIAEPQPPPLIIEEANPVIDDSSPTDVEIDTPAQGGDSPAWLTVLLLLVFGSVIAWIGARIYKSLYPPQVVVQVGSDHTYTIGKNRGILITADPNAVAPAGWETLHIGDDSIPMQNLAKIYLAKAGIRIEPQNCEMRVSGMVYNPHTIPVGNEETVEFSGEQVTSTGLRRWDLKREIKVRRAT